ncbi:MAG: N(4)-(beta-N-acetylglucosaminyl)-L-asparaginase [Planctomycetota bacterium]
MSDQSRRAFLAAAGATVAAGGLARSASAQQEIPVVRRRMGAFEGDNHRGRCVISSGNGLPATQRAMQLIAAGADPADAVVAGVTLVENDPNDVTVGFGGLPNEHGVVQLDASVMHGPTHKAGAVAAIENIKNPAAVALLVLKTTDHVLIVGEGAKTFARQHGFREQELMTPKAREFFLQWKRNNGPNDDWLDDDQRDLPIAGDGRTSAVEALGADIEFINGVPHTYGTINCSAVTDDGDVASCTTTSGLSWKIPGRVGDSPIVGAGMFCDNEVGAAGGTGRGEAVIQNCGAFSIVREMENGATPTEACLTVLKRIADRTKQKRLLDDKGRPNFNVVFYAVRKDGAFGSACMLGPGRQFAVHDGEENRLLDCAVLFPKDD